MLVPHPFDIIAILLGIFLALRKSDVRSDDVSRYPGLSHADFDKWREMALSAYTLGARTCFLRVMFDFAFLAYLQRTTMNLAVQRGVGVAIDVIWIAVLISVYVRSRRARQFLVERGMFLNPPRDAHEEA